jgi:hypothetical protein
MREIRARRRLEETRQYNGARSPPPPRSTDVERRLTRGDGSSFGLRRGDLQKNPAWRRGWRPVVVVLIVWSITLICDTRELLG